MQFSDKQIQRYSRHLILPEVGLEGQKKICSASVLCVGAGGLGSPAIIYLASAGVGRLGIVDFDLVDISNLQRQIAHTTENIGIGKTESALKTVKSLNPNVNVDLYNTRFSPDNAQNIIKNYDVILDCSDNFPTRYILNDVCVALKKPLIYGAVFQFEGHATVFSPHTGSPCYRCLYPEPPPQNTIPSCAEAGVFCVVPGIIGTIQANEALKLILGIGNSLTGRLLVFNALEMKFREIKIKKDLHCTACGNSSKLLEKPEYKETCPSQSLGTAASTISLSENPSNIARQLNNTIAIDEISPDELKKNFDSTPSNISIIDVREEGEIGFKFFPSSIHIPLSALESKLASLNPDLTYYIVCPFGIRSKTAVQLLKQHGFKKVRSLKGGLSSYYSKYY